MLRTQRVRIIRLKAKIPKLLHIRQLALIFMSQGDVRIPTRPLRASPTNMLHDDGRNRPPQLVVFIGELFRDHIDISNMP